MSAAGIEAFAHGASQGFPQRSARGKMGEELGHGTPWKINMEPTNHPLERKMIFQTSMIMFHVNLLGCNGTILKHTQTFLYFYII